MSLRKTCNITSLNNYQLMHS